MVTTCTLYKHNVLYHVCSYNVISLIQLYQRRWPRPIPVSDRYISYFVYIFQKRLRTLLLVLLPPLSHPRLHPRPHLFHPLFDNDVDHLLLLVAHQHHPLHLVTKDPHPLHPLKYLPVVQRPLLLQEVPHQLLPLLLHLSLLVNK